MNMNSNKRTALITGASSGLGKSLALLLAQSGYNLILMARRGKLLDELKNRVLAGSPDCEIKNVVSDVSLYEIHMDDIKKACADVGSLDLVIANAGVGFTTDECGNTWEKTHQTFAVNLLGGIATIEAAKDIMIKQGQGHIVGISSIADVRGMPLNSAYCASKAGFTTFLESMRVDLKSHGIVVTSVHPGFIATPMTEKNGPMPWIVSSDLAAKKIIKAIQKEKSRYYFPWQVKKLRWLMHVMPNWCFDFFAKMSMKRVKKFKKHRD